MNIYNWNDWRWQLKNGISGVGDAATLLGTSFPRSDTRAREKFPFLVTPYLLELIRTQKKNDNPLVKQFLPSANEMLTKKHLTDDPLCEEEQMPVPSLIHRYPGRALLLLTNRCPAHCRFCFRKRKWKSSEKKTDISLRDFRNALKYISGNEKIREVILSGGDPLLIENKRLGQFLQEITRIPNVRLVRIHSRVLSVLPMRIDRELVKILSGTQGLWLSGHFNHPAELTKESRSACAKLVSSGVPLLSQTVLLKGINDDADILEELFLNLAAMKIKPYYLFYPDPVTGVMHFRTGLAKALGIMRELLKRLPHHAVPSFAIDLPGGGGKVHLLPDMSKNGAFEAISGKFVKYTD